MVLSVAYCYPVVDIGARGLPWACRMPVFELIGGLLARACRNDIHTATSTL